MTNIDTETSKSSSGRSPWSNLISSLKCKLQKWVREEIVDDDPWDEDLLMPKSEKADSKDSPDFSKTDSIE